MVEGGSRVQLLFPAPTDENISDDFIERVWGGNHNFEELANEYGANDFDIYVFFEDSIGIPDIAPSGDIFGGWLRDYPLYAKVTD